MLPDDLRHHVFEGQHGTLLYELLAEEAGVDDTSAISQHAVKEHALAALASLSALIDCEDLSYDRLLP